MMYLVMDCWCWLGAEIFASILSSTIVMSFSYREIIKDCTKSTRCSKTISEGIHSLRSLAGTWTVSKGPLPLRGNKEGRNSGEYKKQRQKRTLFSKLGMNQCISSIRPPIIWLYKGWLENQTSQKIETQQRIDSNMKNKWKILHSKMQS